MELTQKSSTIYTFLDLDLMTLEQYIPICIMMHINFFTGNIVTESVRSFKLWLFGMIASQGGARGQFVTKTKFNLRNIYLGKYR